MCCSNVPPAIPVRSSAAPPICSRPMLWPARISSDRSSPCESRASSATACSANLRPGKRHRPLRKGRIQNSPTPPRREREPEPLPKSASDSPSLLPSRKLDRDMQIPPETQVVIDFDDNRAASALVGPYGQNLAKIAG